jgi:hypothetical protein
VLMQPEPFCLAQLAILLPYLRNRYRPWWCSSAAAVRDVSCWRVLMCHDCPMVRYSSRYASLLRPQEESRRMLRSDTCAHHSGRSL